MDRKQLRRGLPPWLAASAVMTLLAAACESTPAPLYLTINAGADVVRPTQISISWLSGRGTLYQKERIPTEGSLPTSGPLVTIAVEMNMSDITDRKILVRGLSDNGQSSIGAIRIPFAAEPPAALSLEMHAALPDQDGNGLPDVIDDCVAAGCQVSPPDSGALTTAADAGAPAAAPEAGAPTGGIPDRTPAPPPPDARISLTPPPDGSPDDQGSEMVIPPPDAGSTGPGVISRNGLVAAWMMEGGNGGQVLDDTKNGNTGSVRHPTGNEWAPGLHGKALLLDGTNWIFTPGSASFDTLDVTLSLAAWVWWSGPSDVGGWQAIIARQKGTDNTNWFWFGLHGDTLRFAVLGTNNDAQLPMPTSRWVHVAATFDGVNLVIYVDGVEVSRRMFATTLGSGPRGITVGGDTNSADSSVGSALFQGKLDDVLIYNRALSAEEIADLARP